MKKKRLRSKRQISVSARYYQRITHQAPRDLRGHIASGWLSGHFDAAINHALDAAERNVTSP
jgi:hypothetical protein